MSGPSRQRAPKAEPHADGDWRELAAQALEARALQIEAWLALTDRLLEQAAADQDEATASELRQAAGRMRSKRNELTDYARRFRAALAS
jgi:hypothetical protein